MKTKRVKKVAMWMFRRLDYYVLHEDYGRARAMQIVLDGEKPLTKVHISPITPSRKK